MLFSYAHISLKSMPAFLHTRLELADENALPAMKPDIEAMMLERARMIRDELNTLDLG